MGELAIYYDKIYGFKDYAAEAEGVAERVKRHGTSGGAWLLDVACGTGRHIAELASRFSVEGLDLSPEMLEIARRRNPGARFHLGDMAQFSLERRFDVVTCLFSSIGYARTVPRLNAAVRCMAEHLAPGGVLIIEPWLTPDTWSPGSVHALLVDEPELKIARVNTSFADGRISYFDLHHLIGTPQGTRHVCEHHELGLFTVTEMTQAIEAAGLVATYEEVGLTGRGLHIGVRAATEEARG